MSIFIGCSERCSDPDVVGNLVAVTEQRSMLRHSPSKSIVLCRTQWSLMDV